MLSAAITYPICAYRICAYIAYAITSIWLAISNTENKICCTVEWHWLLVLANKKGLWFSSAHWPWFTFCNKIGTTSFPQGPKLNWCLTSDWQVLLTVSSTSKSTCLCFSPVTLPSIRRRWHLRTLTRAALLWYAGKAVFVAHTFHSFSTAWKERQGRMLWPMKSIPSIWSLSDSIPKVIEKDIWVLDPYPWLQRATGDEKLAACSPAKGGIQLQEILMCLLKWPSAGSVLKL